MAGQQTFIVCVNEMISTGQQIFKFQFEMFAVFCICYGRVSPGKES